MWTEGLSTEPCLGPSPFKGEKMNEFQILTASSNGLAELFLTEIVGVKSYSFDPASSSYSVTGPGNRQVIIQLPGDYGQADMPFWLKLHGLKQSQNVDKISGSIEVTVTQGDKLLSRLYSVPTDHPGEVLVKAFLLALISKDYEKPKPKSMK